MLTVVLRVLPLRDGGHGLLDTVQKNLLVLQLSVLGLALLLLAVLVSRRDFGAIFTGSFLRSRTFLLVVAVRVLARPLLAAGGCARPVPSSVRLRAI